MMAAGSVTRIWSVDITVNGLGVGREVGAGTGSSSPGVRHALTSKTRAATASSQRRSPTGLCSRGAPGSLRSTLAEGSARIGLLQHSRHGSCVQVSEGAYVEPPRSMRDLHAVGHGEH